ncbi:zinc-binding alcohol dehydrogenase family protein [Streptomyces longwoodensis]|uniref:quinone oxidoreductase family protein n=1 Tax=Streptomyces longwoodensis TaxID=68231 RepID=UPI0038501AAE
MKAAVLHELGSAPEYDEFPAPTGGPGNSVLRVAAAGVHHLVLLRASGRFYGGVPEVPHVVGTDGVGFTEDGQRVFFDETVGPYGAWAEQTLVRTDRLMPVAPGIDDLAAAALGNTGLVAWTALTWRARLKPGETVLVLGATGALGRIAHQAARALGAGAVVAADLPGPALDELAAEPGLTAVPFQDDPDDFAQRVIDRAGPVDVIIDPLWGLPALGAIRAARQGARLIQMGQVAAPSLDLLATDLRARAMDLRSYALFHCPFEDRRDAYLELTQSVADGKVRVDLEAVSLREVKDAWERQAGGVRRKLVLVPEPRG